MFSPQFGTVFGRNLRIIVLKPLFRLIVQSRQLFLVVAHWLMSFGPLGFFF